MLLKKLQIKNIRSYKDQTITFPQGSTLLMGDIGSGKTSVLLAIEFALFGLQPSQRGSSLLRTNEDDAFVKLEFELDGKEVSIERKLKKGSKSISQCDAAIVIENERFEGAVTEIKSRVLKLLNYPKEFAKKTNDLYKFTVYTPQEEMKQIVLETSETRLNTLRHVFGIDKYKRISENLSTIGVKLRQEIRIKEAQLGDLDLKTNELETKKQLIIKEQELIKQIQEEANLLEAKKEIKQQEIKDLDTKIQEKTNLEKEKAKSEILLSTKKEHLLTYDREISSLRSQVEEGKKFTYDEEKIKALQTRIQSQEELLRESQEALLTISSKIQSNEIRKREIESLKTKIMGLESCPTCLQDVNEQYKSNILSKANEELNVIIEQTGVDLKTKQDLNARIDSIKKQRDAFKTTLSEMEILKIKLQGLEEKQIRIQELENRKLTDSKDIEMIQGQVIRFNEMIQEFSKYAQEFQLKNSELQEIINQERTILIKKTETNKEIQFLEQQISRLQEEILKLKNLSSKINDLKSLESWLTNKFSQLILYTEKNVMLTLREEFSELFSSWFSTLVSDTLRVRLDESFSPIIEQQDYELDYNYLSGGERTAIALAYRLALNQVINSLLSKIKTHDLVILDEPTDGFSDSQLDKMRDVLGQLNVKQLILVSHEQKIEGFVDNIIRFEKNEGVTEVK
jgi:DNA repair protein SbcC/Rad50